MTTLNTITVVDRHNRPGVTTKVLLRMFFVNDGQYADPLGISCVDIFTQEANTSPRSIISSANLPNSPIVSAGGALLMRFENSAVEVDNSGFNPRWYSGTQPTRNTTHTSGIYKLGVGQYAVVLDGGLSITGRYEGSTFVNTASAAVDYLDVWTVCAVQGGTYNAYFNAFSLFSDTFYTITEPLLVSPRNHLINKHIKFGSKENIKITTDIVVENKGIPEEVKNLFKNSAMTSAMLKIEKLNNVDDQIPARVEVSGYADTSAVIDLTSEDTIIFLWDTNVLKTHPKTLSGDLGSLTGMYGITAKYTIATETFVSPMMHILLS